MSQERPAPDRPTQLKKQGKPKKEARTTAKFTAARKDLNNQHTATQSESSASHNDKPSTIILEQTNLEKQTTNNPQMPSADDIKSKKKRSNHYYKTI